MKTTTSLTLTFRSLKLALFRGKTTIFNLEAFARVYTHGNSSTLKNSFFTGKFDAFLTPKWLFLEGFWKMLILVTWELVFETLALTLFCEGFL